MLCVNPQDHPGTNRAGGVPGVGITSSVVALPGIKEWQPSSPVLLVLALSATQRDRW
jgi:hypothetical protein